jgi:ribosome-associated protein
MERAEDAPGQVRLAPTVWVASEHLQWSQSRSGGPGGQNVNKTESKAELRLPPAAIHGLDPAARNRLTSQPGLRLDADGCLLIVCDETRSLRRNRDLALERLRESVLQALIRPRVRRVTKPSRGAKLRRLEAKLHNARRKDQRRVSDD